MVRLAELTAQQLIYRRVEQPYMQTSPSMPDGKKLASAVNGEAQHPHTYASYRGKAAWRMADIRGEDDL